MDVQTVWQCGLNNTGSSTDGAKSWQNSSAFGGGMRCWVSFADAKTGWAGPATKLQATTDGGASWQKLVGPDKLLAGNLAAISLRTPSDGYMLAMDGTLYTTGDGGKGWSANTPVTDHMGELKLMKNDVPLAAVRFWDADHGLIVLGLAGGGQAELVALRTVDGGKTWTEEYLLNKVGMPYVTHDGQFVTVVSVIGDVVTVLHYEG